MARKNTVLNYIPKDSIIHSLTGTTKLFIFLLLSFASIITYDTRVLIGLFIFCVICFIMSKIKPFLILSFDYPYADIFAFWMECVSLRRHSDKQY